MNHEAREGTKDKSSIFVTFATFVVDEWNR